MDGSWGRIAITALPVLARIEATTGTIAGISIYLAGEEGQ